MKKTVCAILALVLSVLCVACGPAPAPVAEGAGLAVHFIDVGQADAALVICDDATMLIDGGNREDSSLIYSYLKNEGITHLDYVVATHAHEDHVGGLPGALSYATVGTALCSVTEHDSGVFKTFVNQLAKQGKTIAVPETGETFALGGAQVQVLGPVRESDDPNNMSIVLRIVYGETSFLFTGDAEREEEQDILAAGFDLESTVLKVGHHGSENSTTYPFLREIMPEYAVISVGADNSYGHPTHEALSRLRDAGATVLRTDESGTIVCTSDGKTVSFSAERETHNESEQTGGEMEYVLNTSSKKFHAPSCSSVQDIGGNNRATFSGTRSELLAQGYSPCGNCKP
ncbi:MAG: MBL fold metallo-hydrolase [Ruminococcaceae bacterium]|nr:MBL fold metallo-hydrolase [Oscillospiraceae bacterium]